MSASGVSPNTMTPNYKHAAAILEAWPDVEYNCDKRGWRKINQTEIGVTWYNTTLNDPTAFRLKPRRKLVKLEQGDLPVLFAVRLNHDAGGTTYFPLAVTELGVLLWVGHNPLLYSWERLFDNKEADYGVPGEAFHPFSKEVEE